MLTVFFSAVYFYVFFRFLDLIFFRALAPGLLPNLLTVACLVIILGVSIGLAEYTVKRLEEKYRK